MKREKLVQNIISNVVIFSLVAVVFLFSFGDKISAAIGQPSENAIYRGNPEKNNVSIMINVYWGTEHIDGMLKALADNGVKATFFIGGSWANRHPEVLKNIHDEGHELGNHGYFHKDHKKLSFAKNTEEILICEKIIETICGVKTALFAPPSGSYNNTTLKAAAELGYKTIMWSKDTIDWRDKDQDKIYSRATKNLKNGDLVLMHPTEATLAVLDKIIKYYKRQGFSVVTVSENIA
ncbi:MAG: polysaccharide deacetylase family protein [Clostridiales bacterium]|nr:polysaccharide deacetylase family protein [Clostridiales bacterium]